MAVKKEAREIQCIRAISGLDPASAQGFDRPLVFLPIMLGFVDIDAASKRRCNFDVTRLP
jgi:hypothetical protein